MLEVLPRTVFQPFVQGMGSADDVDKFGIGNELQRGLKGPSAVRQGDLLDDRAGPLRQLNAFGQVQSHHWGSREDGAALV